MVQEKDLDTSHVWVTLINTELIGICFSGSETDLLSTTKYLLRGHIFIGLLPKCIKIFWGQSKIMVFQPRSEKHDLFLKRRKEGVVRLLMQCCQLWLFFQNLNLCQFLGIKLPPKKSKMCTPNLFDLRNYQNSWQHWQCWLLVVFLRIIAAY